MPHHTFPNTRKKYMGGYWKTPFYAPTAEPNIIIWPNPQKAHAVMNTYTLKKTALKNTYPSGLCTFPLRTDGQTDRVARIIRAEKKNFFRNFFFAFSDSQCLKTCFKRKISDSIFFSQKGPPLPHFWVKKFFLSFCPKTVQNGPVNGGMWIKMTRVASRSLGKRSWTARKYNIFEYNICIMCR